MGLNLVSFVYYFSCVPGAQDVLRPRPWAVDYLPKSLSIIIYPLAVLRLPYTILPYTCRAILFLAFHFRMNAFSGRMWFEVARVLGDFANWSLLSAALLYLGGRIGLPLWVSYSFIVAESIHLLSEKGVMVSSGVWQHLPHRWIASELAKYELLAIRFAKYICYYQSDDAKRMQIVLGFLRGVAQNDSYLAARLTYVNCFRIVSDAHSLRAGDVRDVARGEIFIHRRWTSDPYLLIGLALRRSPFVFDPRFLARPFKYRTQANPLVTVFVFRYAYLMPPFALFQFGHEIKSARYELFLRFLRAFRWNLETPIRADGQFDFDPLIQRFVPRVRGSVLPDDAQTIGSIIPRLTNGETVTPMDVASEFVYPLTYVEQVLWDKIMRQRQEMV